MTTVRCRVNADDRLTAEPTPTDLGSVHIGVNVRGTREQVFLTPADARKFAKAIKKAAKRAEEAAQ